MRLSLAYACLLTALAFVSLPGWAQTWNEYNDPGFWQRQKKIVTSPDESGMALGERSQACEEQTYRISREVDRAGGFIIKYSVIASPSRGYITQGAAVTDQREIGTFATVAYRDIRYERYEGADVRKCKAHADFAIERIQNVLRKYPDFDKYDPNSSTVYR